LNGLVVHSFSRFFRFSFGISLFPLCFVVLSFRNDYPSLLFVPNYSPRPERCQRRLCLSFASDYKFSIRSFPPFGSLLFTFPSLFSLSHTSLLSSTTASKQEQAMVSSTLISLLALTPLAFASPTPTTTQEVEKRGLGYGGIGLGYGGGWGGCKLSLSLSLSLLSLETDSLSRDWNLVGRDRFRKERFRKNKNKTLLAKERKHRFNLDKDQALAAKNYKETNFAAEKDRKFDDAKINKVKIAKLAKEKDLRKKLRKGGGDFWKRQFEGDGFGLGGGIYDGGYYGGGGFGGGFGGFDGGIYDGGIGYFGGGQGQNDGESSLGE